jgi:hypothetical protein
MSRRLLLAWRQRSAPVTASTARTSVLLVVKYSAPAYRIGVASNADRVQSLTPAPSSPVRKVQATVSSATLAGVICVRGE